VETIRSINEDFIPDSDSMPSANISPEFRSINENLTLLRALTIFCSINIVKTENYSFIYLPG